MKAIRIFFRSISESFKSVFRNFSLSLASISCITITLILVGFSMILSFNVNNFTAEIEKDLNIVVFLKREVKEKDIEKVKKEILEIENVDEDAIEFNSKADVKQSMQEESEVFKSVLENYTDETNPLQDTFIIKVDEIEMIGSTADKIKKIENVDIVKYGEGSVEELVKIFNIVKNVTYIVVVALIVVTAFLITNTIKITIQSRSREIEIRRLVGASNAFIRQPFFFEGIILGILGSIIPVVACCFGYSYLYDKLGGQLFTAIIKLVEPTSIIYTIMIVLVAVGAGVGAFGSYISVRRHLKI